VEKASSANDSMVEIEDLTKAFGHFHALEGINLKVKKGEFLTIFGPNGAGKTTLIKILSTLIKSTSGKVVINGYDVKEEGEDIRRTIGLVSHQPYLYENLSAYENIIFFGRMYDINHLENRAHQIIEEVGLKERMHDLVRNFSRGMQQRLSIARALINRPQLLFLDEPFTGLDQHAAQILQGYLRRFHDEGRTSIMTTHNISEGLELSDRITILHRGNIVYEELVDNLNIEQFKKIYFSYVGEE